MNKLTDEEIQKYIDKIDFPSPIVGFTLFGITFFMWSRPEFYFELIETEPYALDGSMPSIMVHLAWFEFIFESKTLYRFFYKRKYGEEPAGME